MKYYFKEEIKRIYSVEYEDIFFDWRALPVSLRALLKEVYGSYNNGEE